MWDQPPGRSFPYPVDLSKQADLFAVLVVAFGQVIQASGDGAVNQEELTDRLTLSHQLLCDAICEDASNRPSAEGIRSACLSTADLPDVHGSDFLNAAVVLLWYFHVRAVHLDDGNGRIHAWQRGV